MTIKSLYINICRDPKLTFQYLANLILVDDYCLSMRSRLNWHEIIRLFSLDKLKLYGLSKIFLLIPEC